MENIFDASHRTWISSSKFIGAEDVYFLKQFGNNLGKLSVASGNEQGSRESENDRVLRDIESLGDAFFGDKSGKRNVKLDDDNPSSDKYDNTEGEVYNKNVRDEKQHDLEIMNTFKVGCREDLHESDSSSEESTTEGHLFHSDQADGKEEQEFVDDCFRNYVVVNFGRNMPSNSMFAEPIRKIFAASTSKALKDSQSESPEIRAGADKSVGRDTENTLAEKTVAVADISDQTAAAPGRQFFPNFFKQLLQKQALKMESRKGLIRSMLEMDNKQFEVLWSQISTSTEELIGAPMADEAVASETVMPLLAPPIPHDVLQKSAALSIYVNFSTKPGPFQWSCKCLNEQATDDLWINHLKQKKLSADSWTQSIAALDDRALTLVFTILFYHRSEVQSDDKKVKEPELALKFEIRGDQTLEDMRRMFYCDNDVQGEEIHGEFLPAVEIDMKSCEKSREEKLQAPCAMFIGNTIYANRASYEDPRYNYADAVQKWFARDRNRKKVVGPFLSGNLEQMHLRDLVLKPGHPYLFVHEGNCEHLLVFENVRLPNSDDWSLRLEFPLILSSNFRTMYCHVDNRRIARYAVRKMDDFPQDPMLVCPECLEQYCYYEKKKIGLRGELKISAGYHTQYVLRGEERQFKWDMGYTFCVECLVRGGQANVSLWKMG